ncbi:MAG: sulfotransferase, partial [Pirellulales bacterium]
IRDPYVVFPSTLRLWKSLHEVQALQIDSGDSLEEYVFKAFEEMYHAFERDKENVGANRLYEIRYEDLIANPVEIMSHAYERLGIGNFEKVRERFEKQSQAMKTYKTNTYDLEPRLAREITNRWGTFIHRYGYQIPETVSSLQDASSDHA